MVKYTDIIIKSNGDFNGDIDADIVFLHGISSSTENAWKNKYNILWPDWFTHIYPSYRVVLVDYPSTRFFGKNKSKGSIAERSTNIIDLLISNGIGKRSIVFVCHSLGGILAKEILRISENSDSFKIISNNTKGVVFIATPHAGSDSASFVKLIGSDILKELCRDSAYLLDIKKWFSGFVKKKCIYVSGYGERYPTYGRMVVDLDSANPCCDNCLLIPLDYDHVTITKPDDLSSDIFRRIERDIDRSTKIHTSMNANSKSIAQIVCLPQMTNQLFNEAVDLIHKLAQASGNDIHTSITARPVLKECVVVTKDINLYNMTMPLQIRWPKSFIIEIGVFGELTSSKEKDAASNLLKTSVNFVAGIVGDVIVALTSLVTKINIASYWKDEEDKNIYIMSSAHKIFIEYQRAAEEYLDTSKNPKIEQYKKLKNASDKYFKLFESLNRAGVADPYEDIINESINSIYRYKNIRIQLRADKSYDNDIYSKAVEFRIHHVNYDRDIIIFSYDSSGSDYNYLGEWLDNNSAVNSKKQDATKYRLRKNQSCTSSATGKSVLKIMESNESAVFLLGKKIVNFRHLISLSGGEIERGDSGSAIKDNKGRVVAFIIGRTVHGDESRILAMPISDYIEESYNKENILRLPELNKNKK